MTSFAITYLPCWQAASTDCSEPPFSISPQIHSFKPFLETLNPPAFVKWTTGRNLKPWQRFASWRPCSGPLWGHPNCQTVLHSREHSFSSLGGIGFNATHLNKGISNYLNFGSSSAQCMNLQRFLWMSLPKFLRDSSVFPVWAREIAVSHSFNFWDMKTVQTYLFNSISTLLVCPLSNSSNPRYLVRIKQKTSDPLMQVNNSLKAKQRKMAKAVNYEV